MTKDDEVCIPCLSKGQLISKQNFWAITSSKNERNALRIVSWVRFVCFLEEVMARQFCFEIYWPLAFLFYGKAIIHHLYRWKCLTWTDCAPVGIFSFEISWQLCFMVFEHFSSVIFWIGTFRFAGLFQLSYPPGFDNTSWIKNSMYHGHAAS